MNGELFESRHIGEADNFTHYQDIWSSQERGIVEFADGRAEDLLPASSCSRDDRARRFTIEARSLQSQ